jgi:hypothetical protein
MQKKRKKDVHRLFPVESWKTIRYKVTMMPEMRDSSNLKKDNESHKCCQYANFIKHCENSGFLESLDDPVFCVRKLAEFDDVGFFCYFILSGNTFIQS